MNILIIARADHSGAGYALKCSVNLHTDHECRAIAYKGTWLEYGHDIMEPAPAQVAKWAEWADVVNVHGNTLIDPAISGKPIVTTYHGSYYRNHWQELNTRDRLRGYVQTALTIDLAQHGPRWIGRAMEDLGESLDQSEAYTVVHSPTQPRRKGTAWVRQACAQAGAQLDVITKVSNIECLRRKARGHVLVDQVGPSAYGYGTSALEAWSMGLPVISGCSDELFQAIVGKVGYCPFVRVQSVVELRDAILALQSAEYRRWAEQGRGYVRRYHDPAYVAGEFVRACREAIG